MTDVAEASGPLVSVDEETMTVMLSMGLGMAGVQDGWPAVPV